LALWQYTAQTAQGKELAGEIEAKNQDDLRAILTQRRLRLVKATKKAVPINLNFGSGITSQDVGRFTRQFSAMNEAGLPLLQALDILQDQTDNPAMKEVMKKVTAKIQGGGTLSEALQMHPKVFSELYCHMVAAGEAGGILDQILKRLAEYQEKAERMKRKIKGAMMYPVIVMIVAVVVVAVLMVFVVPVFAKMFESAGGALPTPTKIVMQISEFFQHYILHMIASVVAGLIVLKRYYKTPHGRYNIDKIKLKTPGIGTLESKSSVARFSRTLGTLLNSGVSIIDALHVTGKTSGNRVMELGIEKVITSISGGNTISEPLKDTGIFPPMVVQMIGVGEKSGALPDMLLKISDFYDEEVDAAVDALTSMIEPLIIVFLGVVIGGILVAMYLPIFSLTDTVK
jgi:type IV pilus assembly protein PilC